MKKVNCIIAGIFLAIGTSFAQEKPEKFSVTPIGRFYLDGTAFFNSDPKLGSGATFSDIRLGIKGKYQKFQGKAELGFSKNKISLKDIFVEYDFHPNSYVRAGHFGEPFGIDYMESSANIKFISAGAVTEAFAPGRKLGIEYIGWKGWFWYAGGVFGDTHFQEKINYTQTDGYAVTGRIAFNPIKEQGGIVHIGVASTFRRPDPAKEGNIRDVTFGATLGSPINSQKFVEAKVTDARNTFKVTGEFIGAIHKFSLQSEFFYIQTNRYKNLPKYQALGTYGQIGFLAIGDGYSYANEWARLKLPKPGSLEFVARYSYLDLNDQEANILGGKQKQLSLACNYYWKKFITLRLNYDHACINGAKENQHFNFLSARVQVYF